MALERETDGLIEGLAAKAAPVRRLAPPFWRALGWLALAMVVFAAAVMHFGMRPDFMAAMARPGEWLSWIAGWLTGIAATFAAFHLAIPGRSSNWALLPIPVALLWLSGLSLGCYADWVRLGPQGIQFGGSFDCFVVIVVMSAIIGLPLGYLLRAARFVRPISTAVMGGLAMASLSSAALEMFHRADAQFVDIVAHMSAVLVVILVCASTSAVVRWPLRARERRTAP